jgi:uncharacterized protein YehS (DUF1456 family)
MTNNYILRRIRYTFDFNDKTMIAIWALADTVVTREEISVWLKKDEDPEFKNCSDRNMAIFLNGLINKFRGKIEGPQHAPDSRNNNNNILRKLKIALNLNEDEVLAILALAEMELGKSELTAFFRKEGHKHYRRLQDQMLRRFLQGMEMKYKKPVSEASAEPSESFASDPVTASEPKEQVNSELWGKSSS